MVTRKAPAGKKLKLKKETIRDLNPKGTVKGGVATGANCYRRGGGGGGGTTIVPAPATIPPIILNSTACRG